MAAVRSCMEGNRLVPSTLTFLPIFPREYLASRAVRGIPKTIIMFSGKMSHSVVKQEKVAMPDHGNNWPLCLGSYLDFYLDRVSWW